MVTRAAEDLMESVSRMGFSVTPARNDPPAPAMNSQAPKLQCRSPWATGRPETAFPHGSLSAEIKNAAGAALTVAFVPRHRLVVNVIS